MNEILFRYHKYGIEYNEELGIIIINKPIEVKEFLELKRLLKRTLLDVNDIRILGYRTYY